MFSEFLNASTAPFQVDTINKQPSMEITMQLGVRCKVLGAMETSAMM
jgi:hypothetical protein